jgi:hypothetical protein
MLYTGHWSLAAALLVEQNDPDEMVVAKGAADKRRARER